MSSTIINTPKKTIRRAKESSTAKRAADVPSASDDANTVPKDAEASKAKSKKTIRPTKVDDDMYTTESTDESDVEVREKEPKKPKTNSIETKTIDALKNAATAVVKVSHTYSNVDLFQSLSIFDNLKNGKDRKKRIRRNERLVS
ncbi:hypothetical protein ACTFIY_000294 [Dictyostelium cf. discoideum]